MSELNRPGVIDLSKIASTEPTGGTGVSYARVFTDDDFQEILNLSVRFPVVLLLTMDSARETHALTDTLVRLTNQAAGRWLLAKVDVQNSPQVARALQVQAVPMVIAFIGGQVAPLFQGTKEEAEISALLDQVVQAAIAGGISGRAQPVPGGLTVSGTDSDEAEPDAAVMDPRFIPADEALAKGDFKGALAEFDKLLETNPRDTEAAAGRAQVSLLLRTEGVDLAAAITAADEAPGDIALQLVAADAQATTGDFAGAFDRLLRAVREHTGADKDTARKRLLELFSTADPQDPAVGRARRELAAALF